MARGYFKYFVIKLYFFFIEHKNDEEFVFFLQKHGKYWSIQHSAMQEIEGTQKANKSSGLF